MNMQIHIIALCNNMSMRQQIKSACMTQGSAHQKCVTRCNAPFKLPRRYWEIKTKKH